MSSSDSLERPIRVNGSEFNGYLDASKYLAKRLSNSHHVIRAFEPNIVGGLVIVEEEKQKLRLVGHGVVGIVDRHMHGLIPGGVTVSGFPGETVDVVAHVEPWKSELLDRGLAWVRVGQEVPPALKLTIRKEHGIEDPQELASRLEKAEQKSVEFIEAILRSEVLEPYARGNIDQ